MNENFNGLNEANSLNNNEMNNQNNLEPTLNGISNTEMSNMESVNPTESSVEPANNINVSSESVSVAEMGAPEVISPMSLNENTSADMNNTNIENQEPMTNPEPVTYNAVNNNVSDFQAGANPINTETNVGMSEPESVYPTTQNVGTSEVYGNSPINETEKKKNSLTAILIIILILVLGAVGGVFAYKYIVMSNPVTIIEKSLTTLGKEAETAIKEYNSEMNKMLNGKMQNELSLTLNEYSLDLLMKMDMKNKAIAAEVDVTVDNEDFLNVEGIVNEEAVYFNLLEDAANNFVYYEDFSEAFDLTKDVEEIDPVLANFATYLGESFKETITKDDFVKTKEKITLENKEANVTKYTLTIDENTFNPFLDNYKNKVINDDQLITYITKLANTYIDEDSKKYEKADVKEEITEMFDDMKLSDEDKSNLSLYIKGANLVRIDYEVEEIKAEILTNDGFNVILSEEGEEKFNLIYKNENLNLELRGEQTVNGETTDSIITFKLEDEKYELNYKADEFDLFVNGEIKTTDTTFEMTFNTEIEGTKYSGKLVTKETISDDIKINTPSNALDLEDESNQITLMEEIQSMPIYPLIESLMETDYEDEYYYDDENYYDYDYNYDTSLDYDSEWEF